MRTINRITCCVAVLTGGVLMSTVVFADSPDQFIKKAIQGNIAEVKMGELAQKNGGSEGVKSFGKMLATDHGKAKEQTAALAKTMNIDVPTEPAPDAKAAYDKMSKLNGAAFDKEFAHHMVMDHKKDISEYEEEAKEKGNPQVSKYATDTLPTLKKHLQTAEALDK
jgi:putative membrane protein